MNQNQLVPIQYYHKHIPSTANSKPLQDMIIVISTYTGVERDFVAMLAQLLGARVNLTYVKKERMLLVRPVADGPMYARALKWQYPVVNSAWLVQCAESAEKLAYRPYLVGNCAEDFPASCSFGERSGVEWTPTSELPMPMDIDVPPLEHQHVRKNCVD